MSEAEKRRFQMTDRLGIQIMNTFAALLLAAVAFSEELPLADISRTAPELKKVFNNGSGSVRLLLIVSPV